MTSNVRAVPGSRLTTGVVGRTLDSIPPAAGALAMGTAIVSIGLSLDDQAVLSRVILAIAAGIWLTLAALVPFAPPATPLSSTSMLAPPQP